jgi:hypothetical protein
MLAPVFKKDASLDFNISKTKILTKGPSADHLFEHTKYFLDTDPDLPPFHEEHVHDRGY